MTYKHEVSVDYAIKLYKGTYLFKKVLSIKKKGKSYTNPQPNLYNKHVAMESNEMFNRQNVEYNQVTQDVLPADLQGYSNNNPDMLLNCKNDIMNLERPNRNKHYRHDIRKYPRSHDIKKKHKDRNTGGVSYRSRKKRYL